MALVIKIDALTTDDVRSVYSGTPGCCCGCRGTHTVNPRFRSEVATARGYDVADDECNASVIARILNTIKRHDEHGTATIETERDYVAAETETRIWIAYLR